MERRTTVTTSATVQLAELPCPAWLCDQRGRISDANERWYRFAGDRGSLQNWWLSDRIVHPDDVGHLRDRWRTARRDGTPLHADVRLRRFDGAWTLHLLGIAPLEARDHGGQRWIGTWTALDLVHGAPAEAESRRLEQLRSDIVATVGHELRTPLTSIYGMAVTLQRGEATLSVAARRELIDVIVDQSIRMTQTVERFLAAGTLEQGHVRLEVRPCDVARVARRVVRDFAAADSASVRIRIDDPARPMMVRADETRLRQVLANLVENAVKYSAQEGDVEVRLRRADDEVCIDVADRGIGIPTREQQHVFERFRRLDPSLSRGVAGTGLGLYIARELARRMDGDVTVRSRPGRGSTFTLRLPAA